MGRKGDGQRVTVHREAPRGGGTSLGDVLRKAGLISAEADSGGLVAPGRDTTGRAPGLAAVTGVADLAGCGKLVVRRERKGHGGRTVTRIEGLGLDDAELEALAREAARALGCGARAEEDVVVVQGEPGERLEVWLRERGARKVVRGN